MRVHLGEVLLETLITAPWPRRNAGRSALAIDDIVEAIGSGVRRYGMANLLAVLLHQVHCYYKEKTEGISYKASCPSIVSRRQRRDPNTGRPSPGSSAEGSHGKKRSARQLASSCQWLPEWHVKGRTTGGSELDTPDHLTSIFQTSGQGEVHRDILSRFELWNSSTRLPIPPEFNTMAAPMLRHLWPSLARRPAIPSTMFKIPLATPLSSRTFSTTPAPNATLNQVLRVRSSHRPSFHAPCCPPP